MSNFDFNFAIPYSVFLIIYAVTMAVILFFAVSSLYHLLKYGFMSPLAVFMTFLLIAGTAFILVVSYLSFSVIDWQQELSFEQGYDSFNSL
ncbi:MAG: hypothetical protein ABIJ81_04395 [Patescibacteria group bacterium]